MKEFERGDMVSMYVDSVKEVEKPLLVYDFSTKSDNHSFVANSIVVHNCMPSQ
jgi:intein/homing endonuclease